MLYLSVTTQKNPSIATSATESQATAVTRGRRHEDEAIFHLLFLSVKRWWVTTPVLERNSEWLEDLRSFSMT